MLLAALLFGVLTMHTLGHPVGEHGQGHGGGHAVVQMHDGGHSGVTADPVAGHGMDPMAVCLAVLASWGLVLLVAGGYLLRRAGDSAAAVRALLLAAVRALPPPRGGRVVLDEVSVLRQ
ncbi:DUF6153 family protein [Kitasatospora sp. NPDC093558]|uniref:DUF6153 family protein n=1 Tax=Kitasatospora sp. NPDC093558 TaxID=3155201 RepID=UPI00342863DC